MRNNLQKYSFDYKFLKDLSRFESKMNDGEFDMYGRHFVRRDREEKKGFFADLAAFIKSA